MTSSGPEKEMNSAAQNTRIHQLQVLHMSQSTLDATKYRGKDNHCKDAKRSMLKRQLKPVYNLANGPRGAIQHDSQRIGEMDQFQKATAREGHSRNINRMKR